MKPKNNTSRKTTFGEWTELSNNILEDKKNRNTITPSSTSKTIPVADPVIQDASMETSEQPRGNGDEKNAPVAAIKLEQEKSEDYLRRLQYLQADFENYRKRMEREISDIRRYGNERLLSDLLIVKDELELALVRARESKQNPVLIEGVGMVLKRLQNLLTKEGVEKIPGKGTMFNPEYHEAALRVVSNDEDEGSVVDEIRPGYMLKGRVLRPSIVKVAEKPTTSSSTYEKGAESLKDREEDSE